MKISVVLCTCNGEKYIVEQLNSILLQTRLPDEIIVADDISEDNTIELVNQTLIKSGIDYHVYQNVNRLGSASNFLKAMKATTGDFVFCCDQDDIWMKDKIECFIQCIKKTHKQLYFSNGLLVNANGESMNCTLWESVHFKKTLLNNTSTFDLILKRCFVTGAAMAVSKQLIDQVDEIPEGWLHDGWFSLLAGLNNSIEAIDKITFYYRQHGNNVVGAHGRGILKHLEIWKRNISRLKQMRKERYLRFFNVKNKKVVGQSKELEDCINFWNDLVQLENKGFLVGLLTVDKHFFKGDYRKYYTGFNGAIRDIISMGYK